MTKKKKKNKTFPDIHWLYEASVQNVDTDLDFGVRIYRKHWKRKPLTIREDFCGTAKLAARWAQRNKLHEAWGIDFHQPTLDWGVKYNVSDLTEKQRKRLHLIHGNVLEETTPKVDMAFALNFSFCVFKKRDVLRDYFKKVCKCLNKEGLFVLDIYGGTEAIMEKEDDVREIPGLTTPDGLEIPDFEYIWDQAYYNPINHDTTCHIHFNVPGYGRIEKAFTYKWRLWTLMELQEILKEAGFSTAEVYLHDFDDDGESDEIYRLRKTYENVQGWVAYVVGVK
ncbi:class I SAM-dependent methyltransferase [Pontiella agarivorans]|uniref:Class I SAM-dependent methyltransferase n=1 Tax=Pontiella agarivorans TaxID=3038953 RepID=A0ABU5MXC1_9BACT|nr:class I SAM-dependent methyltransferase [Pontiella agarivorans]MDZ8118849.1 class I SAM-dependent methyltransferase [Pontiella agarivorans]